MLYYIYIHAHYLDGLLIILKSLLSLDIAGDGAKSWNEQVIFGKERKIQIRRTPCTVSEKRGLAYCLFVQFKKIPAVAAYSGTEA